MFSPSTAEETSWIGLWHAVTTDRWEGVVPEGRGQNHTRERADNQAGRGIACPLRSVPGLCLAHLYKHNLSIASAETMSQRSVTKLSSD